MATADSMFVDHSVKLRDNLPQALYADFMELQKYYEVDDWFHFDIFLEAVEASVKGYYLAGEITREDLNKIFQKYGIG